MSKVIASNYFSEKHCSVALAPALGTDQCCSLGLALFFWTACSVLCWCIVKTFSYTMRSLTEHSSKISS